jgi:N-acetylglucosaminyldiphosphoundecaprenol N-acetyl-beta-D-mannosaminyltransferase
MISSILAPFKATNRVETGNDESPVEVWGLPLMPLTMQQTLVRIDKLIRRGKPGFVITANLNYAMLAASNPKLRAATRKAAFIVADGMPLVWAARWKGRALPERVTGADLVPALCSMAAAKGHRVLLVGGSPGVAAAAADRLREKFPGLEIEAMEAPMFRTLEKQENVALIGRIQKAKPDLLLLACSQPEGEIWLSENCKTLGVPACVQIGAAVDFAAGRAKRAPRWIQGLGLEWLYRLGREPRRLCGRYLRNALYLATAPL